MRYLGQDEGALSGLERDIENVKPRVFDTYVLPAFLVAFAMKAKRPMGRSARRILFTSGVYLFYRNYAQYKALVKQIRDTLQQSVSRQEEPDGTT